MSALLLHPHQSPQQGFTLLELMVVVLIMGILVGLISASVQPDERGMLDVEARRLARLLELVAIEAQVSGRSLVWSAGPESYQFRQQSESGVWLALDQDEALHARQLPAGMQIRSLLVEGAASSGGMRIEFPAYGQTTAFTVALAHGAAHSLVEVSPIGVVTVQTRMEEEP